jgi:hypothetical protein
MDDKNNDKQNKFVNKICYNCEIQGHIDVFCPIRPCCYCKQEGHVGLDCDQRDKIAIKCFVCEHIHIKGTTKMNQCFIVHEIKKKYNILYTNIQNKLYIEKKKIEREERINICDMIKDQIIHFISKDEKKIYNLTKIFRMFLVKKQIISSKFKEVDKYYKGDILIKKEEEKKNDYSLKVFFKNILLNEEENNKERIKNIIQNYMKLNEKLKLKNIEYEHLEKYYLCKKCWEINLNDECSCDLYDREKKIQELKKMLETFIEHKK